MSESDGPSLGEKQPVFVEHLVALRSGNRTDETIRISDTATVRMRVTSKDAIELEVVLSDDAMPVDRQPSLGQNTAGRLIGDIQQSLKTVFDIPMAVEPDFELDDEASNDEALCYRAAIDIESGLPTESVDN